jgi:hypothetical protein
MYMMDGRECPLKKRKPEFVVRGADGKELRLAATEVAEDRFSASCEVDKIAIGSYPVVARLVSRDGKEYDAMSIDFNRVETLPERLAWFDEHHRLIVEGKPFFLLGMYGCGKTDAEADIYADSAFNCTLTGNPAVLNLAATRGLKVLYSTHRLAHADDAKVESECRKMAGRKEVIVWCTNDELPPGLVPQQTLLYNRLRKYDPGRPVYAVLDKCHHVRDFMPSFDVIAMDPYPIGNKRRGPIAMCTEWPRKANEAVFGFRPVWQVPQAFNWEWHRRNFNASSPEHHFPTREEFRSMAWQPIALGVKGLIWYSFDWMLKDSSPSEFKERWGYVKETVGEIARFSPIFLSVEPAPAAKSDNGSVTVRTWRHGDSCWLLCVNTTEKKQTANVSMDSIPRIGNIKAEFGELPESAGGKMRYDLPPLGVSFVRFPASSAIEVDLRTARITVADPENNSQSKAAKELEKHLALIAGERKPSANGFEFAIGRVAPGKEAAKAWEAHAFADGKAVYFWGDDGNLSNGKNYGSMFAVYGFLDEVLGVEWVRPGDDGIVYRKQTVASIPDGWTHRFYPPMEKSEIRVGVCPKKGAKPAPRFLGDNVTPKELIPTFGESVRRYWDFRYWSWRMRHQTRAPYAYGHAFAKWNDRFYDTPKREYMAMWNNGKRGHHIKAKGKYVHICYSNPKVLDQIISDWCEKGTNQYLNVCASDSRTTHCRCEGCRALDADAPGEDFLFCKTDRQVWLWNTLTKKAMKIRPDVKLIGYIYANYRQPPRRWRIEYPDHFIGGIVPSIYDDSSKLIKGWKEKGLKEYFVRPNYLCSKAAVPRGLERYFFEDFKENLKLGMVGVDEDNFKRNFSMAVMFEFYALARVIADPTLTFEEVERDYLKQFGAAASEMKEYYGRVRTRGEAARLAKMNDSGVSTALDDSLLVLTAYEGHSIEDLAGDLSVIARALARTDLTESERRRVEEAKLVVEHSILTMDFLAKGHKKDVSDADFRAAAAKLKEFRLKHAKAGDIREHWQSFFSDKRSEAPLWRRIKK